MESETVPGHFHRMNDCWKVLLLGVVVGYIGELVAKQEIDGKNEMHARNGSSERFEAIISLKSRRKRELSLTELCGDEESYYFEPLNECYKIFRPAFLNIDLDRRIAYGGTRNEYMFKCRQNYRGRLLDIGLEYIGEKMDLVKEMAADFNRRTFKRQTIQVGFMTNRMHELISQSGEHYDVLENVFVEHQGLKEASLCPSVCCVVLLADAEKNSVRMVDTSCDNRTRALSYICEAPALTAK